MPRCSGFPSRWSATATLPSAESLSSSASFSAYKIHCPSSHHPAPSALFLTTHIRFTISLLSGSVFSATSHLDQSSLVSNSCDILVRQSFPVSPHPSPHLSSSQASQRLQNTICLLLSRLLLASRSPFPTFKLVWIVLCHRDESLWSRGFFHSEIGAPSILNPPTQHVSALLQRVPFFHTQTSPIFPLHFFLFFQNTTLPSHSLPQSLPVTACIALRSLTAPSV